MAKKKTNFKEETKIVQQISPVGSIPQTMVQPPQVVAEVSSPTETKSEKKRRQ
jgi:Uma2 family endonuclease